MFSTAEGIAEKAEWHLAGCKRCKDQARDVSPFLHQHVFKTHNLQPGRFVSRHASKFARTPQEHREALDHSGWATLPRKKPGTPR